MDDEIIEEEVEFSQELYEKNLQENTFAEINELEDGIGVDEDENN